MTFEEGYDQVKGFEGWMDKKDCAVLHKYASRIKNGLIVEIGSFGGISTLMLALSSPTSKVIAIDPYVEFSWILPQFLRRVDGHNIELIRDLSENVGEIWDREIDLLHVDGDHHYEAVKRDIELWLPHLKKNKFALFHDYGNSLFGVTEALGETKYKVDVQNSFGVIRK